MSSILLLLVFRLRKDIHSLFHNIQPPPLSLISITSACVSHGVITHFLAVIYHKLALDLTFLVSMFLFPIATLYLWILASAHPYICLHSLDVSNAHYVFMRFIEPYPSTSRYAA